MQELPVKFVSSYSVDELTYAAFGIFDERDVTIAGNGFAINGNGRC